MRVVTIQEAGFDGFLAHRALEAKGSRAMSSIPRRRGRPAAAARQTDRIDADMLLRNPGAFRRGERRVCSMVHAPPASGRRPQAGRT